jgi:WD40 repeat protein
MKFEGQIGRSLWTVAFSEKLGAIATGGADSSVRIWSINLSNEENKEGSNEPDVIKYEFDIKGSYDKLPFKFDEKDQYFIRSMANLSDVIPQGKNILSLNF